MLKWLHGARAWLVGLLIGSAAGLGLRLVLFGLGAVLLRLGAELAGALLGFIPSLDPVYTRAALRSLADLHLQGLAVAGPAGAWLHSSLPDLFASPTRVHWSPVRFVAEPGSPVLARLIAAGMAHAGVVGCGLLVMRRWRVAGLAMQLQVALGILGAQPTVRDLEATGASFAVNALLPWLDLRGQAVSDGLTGIWPPFVAALLVGLALALSYVPAALFLVLRERAWRLSLGTALLVVVSSAACAGVLDQSEVEAAPVPVIQAVAESVNADSISAESVRAGSVTAERVTARSATAQPVPALPLMVTVFDRWYADEGAPPPPAPGPSHVEIVGANYHYHYLVNREPQLIKGMGLNTQYASQLSPADRAARLDADMAELSTIGVNTVLGWDPAEFDEVLLDAAQRHGIGVVMPFDLDPQADYTDPGLRQQLHDEVMDWVARYRSHPALRMWGLGNEVLHKIVHPAWVGPQDPAHDRNAQAFSDWLLATADDIHAADPDHPVTYRSAEDAFVPWLVAAWQRSGNVSRPWFVLGTNCYQSYLQQITDNWPDSGMPTALWVSEFAPGLMGVPDRPAGFKQMWGYVRAHPDYVLGGAVYAWTRNGPEGVDRNLGLTDDGVPADGPSFDALRQMFLGP